MDTRNPYGGQLSLFSFFASTPSCSVPLSPALSSEGSERTGVGGRCATGTLGLTAVAAVFSGIRDAAAAAGSSRSEMCTYLGDMDLGNYLPLSNSSLQSFVVFPPFFFVDWMKWLQWNLSETNFTNCFCARERCKNAALLLL